MNFYKHHLGDYATATAHLSWDEDMAYTRLLRVYYLREKPIHADEIYRVVRANSTRQKAAVQSVLREFFYLVGSNWHNKRADEEISLYKKGEEERSQKAKNETERMRRHRERRKLLFSKLRERGITPNYDTPTEELQRLCNAPVTRTAA